MVGQNPPHTYRKDGVFYYCRRIPKDLLSRYDESRIVMSLRTKSSKAAGRSAAAITSRLDEYWMSLRITDLQIPSIISGTRHHNRQASITLSEALKKYHALRGIGKDELFFRASSRFVKYAIEELGDRNVADYSSMDAATFRDHLFERVRSSSSVKRTFASIRSIVSFAYNDAEVFREYLSETLGMKRQRIQLAANTKATQAEFSKLLGPNGWLARNVVKGKSDIVVYFSGHGVASPDAKSSGLLPYDVDPNYSVGLPTKQLYQDLASMGARSVTVFLDACFTGQTRNEEMLIANAHPIIIKPIAAEIPPNLTVISAASGSQICGAIVKKEHGLFTYYRLKGMSGEADQNNDQAVNLSELQRFVSARVKEQAALNGREQIPEMMGDSNRVLVQLK